MGIYELYFHSGVGGFRRFDLMGKESSPWWPGENHDKELINDFPKRRSVEGQSSYEKRRKIEIEESTYMRMVQNPRRE